MIIIPHSVSRPTARSRELARVLTSAIADFERANPKTSRDDVAAALQEVRDAIDPVMRASRRIRAGVAAGAGTMLAIGLAFTASAAERGRSVAWPLIGLAVVGAFAAALILVKTRDD